MFPQVTLVESERKVILVNKNVELLVDLKDILGANLFKTFVERHPGEVLYLPKRGEYASKEERDEAIKDDFFDGMSNVELADKYNLSITSIYKIVEGKQ